MSSHANPTTCARYNLPASLILGPRELKPYRRWQSLHTTLQPTEYGSIPNAIEYEEFQQWLKKQDSGYFSDVFDDIYEHINPSAPPSRPTIAPLCQHTIYPVEIEQPRVRCPVCTVDMHINYMKVLTRSLHGANGRPLPRTGTPSEQQENLYLAWLQGKLATLSVVDELEALSVKEASWVESHPESACKDVYTAAKALALYWFETTECQDTPQRNVNKKALTFAEDTNFLPGRPTDYFLRKSPRYEPGKYTSLVGENDDDDNVSEDSEDYSGVRVFVLGGPEAPSDLDDEIQVPEELVQSNDLFDDLEFDDGDSDWEDIDSDEEEDSSEGSYICFEEDDDESNFIVFSND